MSFLNLFFSQNYSVNLSILAVVAWVIVAGFEKTWKWIVFLGFLNDIFLSDRIGPYILFFIILTYLLSLVSKRFMIERRFSGFLVVIIFILGSLMIGEVFDSMLDNQFNLVYTWIDLESNFLSWKKMIWGNILAGVCFYLIYKIVNRMEKYISIFEDRLKITL